MSKECNAGCKRKTNNPDGTCTICRMDGKTPVTALMEEVEVQDKQSTGGDKMAEKKAKHRTCSVEGCEKFVVRDGMCTRHYNEANGIVKKKGRAAHKTAKPEAKKEPKSMPQGKQTAGAVPEAALMGAIRKYALDSVRAEIEPMVQILERTLTDLKAKLTY